MERAHEGRGTEVSTGEPLSAGAVVSANFKYLIPNFTF